MPPHDVDSDDLTTMDLRVPTSLTQAIVHPPFVSHCRLKGYEVEPKNNSETLVNLQEYAVASALFYAMLETTACETSQRVMAMDNATENAKDMVHSLSLIYNRARQARITTELSEIIGGATAAEAVQTTSD